MTFQAVIIWIGVLSHIILMGQIVQKLTEVVNVLHMLVEVIKQ